VRKRQLPRQSRQDYSSCLRSGQLCRVGHAGYASRSTDGVRGTLSYSGFVFMVKSMFAKKCLHCSNQGVGCLLEVDSYKDSSFLFPHKVDLSGVFSREFSV
jgi:hypothetical protein